MNIERILENLTKEERATVCSYAGGEGSSKEQVRQMLKEAGAGDLNDEELSNLVYYLARRAG